MGTPSCHKLLPPSSEATWKPIAGWPKYEVSDLGAVRRAQAEIRCRAQHNGYLRVTLSDEPNGRRQTYMVHRLVAAAFHGIAPSARHQVDHRNGNKTDNRAANLQWVTPRQNRRDGRAAKGADNGASKLTNVQVATLRDLYARSSLSVLEIAARFGVSRQTVTKIGQRRAWTHLP